jgi:hypothetical protein
MDEFKQKQWWAPVWKGLVMDADAKHYLKMKNAVWLYLYLLVNANRATGVLMRKTRTITADMGVSRDMILRWLSLLRKEGYIATQNTGRSLTIQINNWKPLAKHANIQPQVSDESNFRCRKYPTPCRTPTQPTPLYSGPKLPVSATANDTKINIFINNDMQQIIAHSPDNSGFKGIGSFARQELLAWDLARSLDDPAGIKLYRAYSQRYPERLLRRALAGAAEVPAHKINKSRGALFTYLVQHYAKGTTQNPGR